MRGNEENGKNQGKKRHPTRHRARSVTLHDRPDQQNYCFVNCMPVQMPQEETLRIEPEAPLPEKMQDPQFILAVKAIVQDPD